MSEDSVSFTLLHMGVDYSVDIIELFADIRLRRILNCSVLQIDYLSTVLAVVC